MNRFWHIYSMYSQYFGWTGRMLKLLFTILMGFGIYTLCTRSILVGQGEYWMHFEFQDPKRRNTAPKRSPWQRGFVHSLPTSCRSTPMWRAAFAPGCSVRTWKRLFASEWIISFQNHRIYTCMIILYPSVCIFNPMAFERGDYHWDIDNVPESFTQHTQHKFTSSRT